MKNILQKIALGIALIALLISPATAIELDADTAEVSNIQGVQDALPDEAKEILDGFTVSDALEPERGIEKLVSAIGDGLGGIVSRAMKSALVILAAVMLCSVIGAVYDPGAVPDYVPLAAVIVIAGVAVYDMSSFLGLALRTLTALSDFSKIFLPSLATAAAAAGAITSASAKYLATSLFMSVLLTAASGIVMPLIFAYSAAVIGNAATGNETLSSAASLMKWLVTTSLTLIVIAFTAYLGLTGVISASSDAVATRLAKTALSTALPVVGSIISDAAATVVAGAGIARGAIGIFGLLAVCAVCLTPFLTLGAYYLMYKAVAGVSSMIADKRLSGLISGIGTAFGATLGLIGAGAIMLFISIISSIRVVTGT